MTAGSHVLAGAPVDVILLTAERLDAQLIVMAGHPCDLDGGAVVDSVTASLLGVVDRPDRRLRDLLHRIETDHPELTRAVNDICLPLI